jgi:hypothetical protein
MRSVTGYLPKIVFCVVGDKDFRREAEPILTAAGVEREWQGKDARMKRAFQHSDYAASRSLGQADFEQIARHEHVLYFLSDNYPSDRAGVTSLAVLRLGARLLEAGGGAMKCESSGLAHSRQRWLELAAQAQQGSEQMIRGDAPPEAREKGAVAFWEALFRAYVQMPLQDGDDLHSCGMHLIGQADLIVAEELFKRATAQADLNANEVCRLFTIFALYLLAECPADGFASGHTFRVADDEPRFRVTWEKCTSYEEDDFFHNPFGRWRFAGVAS